VPQIIWLPEALEDTERLRHFIEDKNPSAAVRVGQVLQKGAAFLASYPEAGRPMNDGTNRRELFLPFGSGAYVLRYITDRQMVVIVRAWHSRENRNKNGDV
jgi:plasmid stabilization system protein ParE